MEKPTLPKGTRDFSPEVMAKRLHILDPIKNVFRKYGFVQMETPAMENLSTLTGKYGDEGDQLLFRILNSGDFLKDVDKASLAEKNSRKISSTISEKGLRYDLTVPFARFVVMNQHNITFPFRRFQIQPVWRADRPQKGRYREFYQCDADVIGTDSLICEAEIILMIREVFRDLNVSDYTIRINHRGLLSGLAQISASQNESALFVAIDKLEKIGKEKVTEELLSKGFKEDELNVIFNILAFKRSTAEKLDYLKQNLPSSSGLEKGLEDVAAVLNMVQGFNASLDHVELDVSLARGLSYYTGCIFEVKVNNVSIGSVGGGGRYDNLTGNFGLPGMSGVGFSFGIDRIYDVLEELSLFPNEAIVGSSVLVAHFDDASMHYGLKVTEALRQGGISTEIYPDTAKLKKQLDYANKKQIPYVIVIGPNEMASGRLSFRSMTTGEQSEHSLDEILKLF